MSVGNRSAIVSLPTPRGPVEVVRQQWRSQRPNSSWEWVWLARWRGQVDWRQAASAREAIRQAMLLRPGKRPPWLAEAATSAEREIG